MEKEGIKRALLHLQSNNVDVDYIVTDRHCQVQKYLREQNITQYYDVWHLEKGKCMYFYLCLLSHKHVFIIF